MSVLGKKEIIAALSRKHGDERLIVTPLLDHSQIGPASIDVRLGHEFIVTRRGNLPMIDAACHELNGRRFLARHHVNRGDKFFLHPHELVLAATLEYVRLPQDIAGSVTSRSSWGRSGLVIATATAVHPGFTGTITLELVNLGEVPLVLYPGLQIAQLILAQCSGAELYEGRFAYRTDPRESVLNDRSRPDSNFWMARKSN